jgi:hypothetical protein
VNCDGQVVPCCYDREGAYAFGNDRPLADVARDVVTRTLRFDAFTGEGSE